MRDRPKVEMGDDGSARETSSYNGTLREIEGACGVCMMG